MSHECCLCELGSLPFGKSQPELDHFWKWLNAGGSGGGCGCLESAQR
jgi:hypothetical protein